MSRLTVKLLWLSIWFFNVVPVALASDRAQDIVVACTQLVTDYAFYRDRPNADAVASLFTADATFNLMGKQFVGREAIRARVAAGAGGAVFRHLVSTINIEVSNSGESARGVTYVVVYRGSAADLPQELPERPTIGEYHDEFRLTQEGWKIAKRAFVPVFLSTQP
jgi:ketosteroid isomerase-like protein